MSGDEDRLIQPAGATLPDRPRLRRDLQLGTVQDERAGQVLVIQDPMGLLPEPLPVAGIEALIVSLLDGGRDLRDVQAEVMRQTGEMIEHKNIEALVEQLDRLHLLESERFQAVKDAIELEARRYRESPVRPMTSVGVAYLEDAERLAAQLDSRMAEVGSPGSPDALAGIASPHIDFQRAGDAYARAYAPLRSGPRPDRVLILGVAHQGCGPSYAATTKNLNTPFGELPCDADWLHAIDERVPFDLFEGEMAHLGEHSIELQAVWIRHLLGAVPVAPVLCNSLHEPLESGEDPAQAEPEVRAFLEAVREALAASGERTLVVAGVDLSHVGPMFGDDKPVSPALLDEVEQSDRRLLDAASRRDAAGFFEVFAATRDATHVCGHAALYATLAILGEGPPGELQAYRQWADASGRGAVSFAAMTFGRA